MKASLSASLGASLTGEIDGLTANADHIFGLWIHQGFEDAGRNVVNPWEGGLGMHNRDNYIESSPKMVAFARSVSGPHCGRLKIGGRF